MAADTLQGLQAELETIRARETELALRIRKNEMVEIDRLRRVTIERAIRMRELLMSSPDRETGTLASRYHLLPALLHVELRALVRETLRGISASGRALRKQG